MRIVVWTSLVICVAAYICGFLDDPDLWWHITIGRWIIAHREVPTVDYWTLFGQGQPWRAYSWSIEVFFALVEGWWGLTGLAVFKGVMVIGLALSAQLVFSRISRSLGVGALLACICTASCFNHITLRPQSFIWILFIWLLFVADRISEFGISRARLFQVALLMCLWANIHLSALLGLALLGCWIATRDSIRPAVITVFSGFLATLCTPYVGGEWLTFVSTGSHPFSFSGIAEFHPATILQYSTAFPIFMSVLLVSTCSRRLTLHSPFRWLLAAGFLIGALAVLKFIPFLMIILCGLVASTWYRTQDKDAYPIFIAIEKLVGAIERIPREGLSFLLIVLAVIYINPLLKKPLGNDVTPISTIDFFEKYQLPFPLLNPFGQGGYVMYRFSNAAGEVQHLPSIDGRTNLISAELWQMHDDALMGRHGWERYIEKVNPKTILWKAESPLTSILRNNSAWCHVFLAGDYTQGYVLFLRRDEFDLRKGELHADNCK